jgi:hypothetical protein
MIDKIAILEKMGRSGYADYLLKKLIGENKNIKKITTKSKIYKDAIKAWRRKNKPVPSPASVTGQILPLRKKLINDLRASKDYISSPHTPFDEPSFKTVLLAHQQHRERVPMFQDALQKLEKFLEHRKKTIKTAPKGTIPDYTSGIQRNLASHDEKWNDIWRKAREAYESKSRRNSLSLTL